MPADRFDSSVATCALEMQDGAQSPAAPQRGIRSAMRYVPRLRKTGSSRSSSSSVGTLGGMFIE